ncbi:Arv1-like family-domain-containing protein [Russula dissimulans]|nr:Arv1-like family-domain-containing protein [Russula dissimulans]
MPLCTNCAQAVPYLYTVYHSVNNVRLEQCPSCHAPADPYVEHDALLLALDLILLKRGVYRHLLFNRGTPPRKVERTATRSGRSGNGDDPRLRKEWVWLIVRVGAVVILVDSFVRWSRLRKSVPFFPQLDNDGEAIVAFLRIMLGCFVETASFHGGITLASIFVLTSLDHVARWRKRANLPLSTIRQQFRHVYSHISLCLFYSSLTKFLLLVVLAIWEPHADRRETPHRHHWPHDHHSGYVYKLPLEGPLWHLLDDDTLDRTWLVRNMLGGMSVGFGLRVVLDCHPFFTSLVILLGCLIKTGFVWLVRELVGPGNGVEETWLAYSIP